jgi:hypothetical protein
MRLQFGFLLLALCGCASFQRPSSQDSNVLNVNGQACNPFQDTTAKAFVFIFVRTDCPVSNQYAPEIRRLWNQYGAQGIAFWLVYPDADTSAENILQHAKEYRLPLPVLRDPRHSLVKRTGVEVTPETAVFLPTGKRIYRGRIDDRHPELGKERPRATKRDLEEVLIAVIMGKPLRNHTTPAVGCYIPEL